MRRSSGHRRACGAGGAAADSHGKSALTRVGKLGAQFRRRMETAFGADFGDVVIDRSPVADAATTRLNTIAAASEQCIYLGAGFEAYDRATRELVLAHELAHVVQKRRGRAARAPDPAEIEDRGLLEAEAHVAARHAVRGECAPIVLADVSPQLSTWGPAGHYYTSYIVMWAAGVEARRARDIAFFCQMPDQVFQFDAVPAGFDYSLTTVSLGPVSGTKFPGGFRTLAPEALGQELVGPPLPAPPDMTFKRTSVITNPYAVAHGLSAPVMAYPGGYYFESGAKQLEIARDVSIGLHALTGGLSRFETQYRETILKKCANDLDFGLALHPYGDSFAHRTIGIPDLMSDPIIGHALSGHKPDKCGKHIPTYILYIKSMYDIVSNHLDHGAPNLTLTQTLRKLVSIYDPLMFPPELPPGLPPRPLLPPSPNETMKTYMDRTRSPTIEAAPPQRSITRVPVRADGPKINDEDDGVDLAECEILAKVVPEYAPYAQYRPEKEEESDWFFFSNRAPNVAIINEHGGADYVYKRIRQLGYQWRHDREAQAAREHRDYMDELMPPMPIGP